MYEFLTHWAVACFYLGPMALTAIVVIGSSILHRHEATWLDVLIGLFLAVIPVVNIFVGGRMGLTLILYGIIYLGDLLNRPISRR